MSARFQHPHAYIVGGPGIPQFSAGDSATYDAKTDTVTFVMNMPRAMARDLLENMALRNALGICLGREACKALSVPCQCFKCAPEHYAPAAYVQYRALHVQLVALREQNQGLDSRGEDPILEAMDDAWWQMTQPERGILDAESTTSLIRTEAP